MNTAAVERRAGVHAGTRVGLRGRSLLVLALLVTGAGVVPALELIPWSGSLPGDAVVAGADASGAALYVCVAATRGGEHPGALSAVGVCEVAWGGQGYSLSEDFKVVTGSDGQWVAGVQSKLPDGAFAAGDDGGPLYVCRLDGRPGKLTGDGWCYLAEDGAERSATSGYEVLVQ
jgi:hypothetical protein